MVSYRFRQEGLGTERGEQREKEREIVVRVMRSGDRERDCLYKEGENKWVR